jgi:hypothetical protein
MYSKSNNQTQAKWGREFSKLKTIATKHYQQFIGVIDEKY